MKHAPVLPRALLVITAIGAALAALYYPFAQAANPPAPVQAKAALTINTITAKPAQWPTLLTANGSIHAWQEAVVGAEIGGLRLTSVLVNVGDHVHKGQLLASMQSDTVAAEIEQTKASLAEAEATLADARSNATRARQAESGGALSAQQITQYLTVELTAQARADVLKARLKSDQLRMAQTRILAPDEGSITSRTATLGSVVQSGQELFRLIRQNRLEWRAEVPEADLSKVRAGMSVTLTTAGKTQVKGKVRMVAPTVDLQTRNGLVYVDLPASADAKAGMFARGEIEQSKGPVLVLPQSAILLRDGFSYVYRVGPDNRVTQTKVTVGRRSGDLIAITNGIKPEDRIASTGVGFLADGDSVRIAPPVANR